MGRAARLSVARAGRLCGSRGDDAAATAPSPPRRGTATNEVGLNPGETMAFEVRLGGVLAGEAAARGRRDRRVRGQARGRRQVAREHRGRGRAAQADRRRSDDRHRHGDTGRPLQLETLVEQGDKTTTAHARRSAAPIADVTYKRSDDPKPHTFKLNFGTQHRPRHALRDGAGPRLAAGARDDALGVRRRWPPAVARRRASTSATRRSARRSATAARSSSRARRIARAPNFRSRADKPARTFTVWLSDDADRVPLKVRRAHRARRRHRRCLTEYNRP